MMERVWMERTDRVSRSHRSSVWEDFVRVATEQTSARLYTKGGGRVRLACVQGAQWQPNKERAWLWRWIIKGRSYARGAWISGTGRKRGDIKRW